MLATAQAICRLRTEQRDTVRARGLRAPGEGTRPTTATERERADGVTTAIARHSANGSTGRARVTPDRTEVRSNGCSTEGGRTGVRGRAREPGSSAEPDAGAGAGAGPDAGAGRYAGTSRISRI
ncbi:hypothetical protein KNU78_gp77 [Gordonia phage Sukkupi]|uniref:Uncharacterized protein n=1 Tax=Gordonia phage Sukkupi TaxID=2653747 RepID=A0A5Q2WJ35_9CAUD|nr:hypothetical protein KNU78_gp77 [Gordonia phage Sukkupi]QGH79320.1 hypothetical protein SEA_SUKKUPI_77 [Gordonia phage Sukkupi]QGH80808.1 hypothetical protein SEA_YNDEXA_77 [Gordonia phage Yndexa]